MDEGWCTLGWPCMQLNEEVSQKTENELKIVI